ncbi:MAG TPA: hypothetical protein DC031_12290 [Sulfitobacter sp.]|uniref:hypothetical protein n=1 Tax=Sulfitobacter dubius TaxID=218673 RepID=UPI000C4B8CBD|nr:hypothetical protein [Sulfitobacter sp.]HBB84024.1 hypothetical protein [Sulfitobacter sp.]
MTDINPDDPKGLIRESYRMEGIGPTECRSVFLDWALSLPEGRDSGAAIARLLDQYGGAAADHPMTQVLSEGQTTLTTPRRRGGWRGRARN